MKLLAGQEGWWRRTEDQGRDRMESEGEEIRGSKVMEGLESQDNEFVPDRGMHWEPDEGYAERLSSHSPSDKRGRCFGQ